MTRDSLNEYLMLVDVCGCLRDLETAVQNLNEYNDSYGFANQPFSCMNRLRDNLCELHDRFEYVKAMWKQSLNDS